MHGRGTQNKVNLITPDLGVNWFNIFCFITFCQLYNLFVLVFSVL